MIDGAKSEWITLHQGIAQGSVFGPIAFTLYMSPLGNICRENIVDAQFFADDEQMYLAFKPKKTDSQEQCITTLEKWISETKTWMGSNRLRHNDDKTEFIIIGSRQQPSKITDIAIKIGNTTIQLVESVWDLDYFLENQLKNGVHINKVTITSFQLLRNIQKIQSHLTQDTANIIVQSLVISRLDYCNSLLLGSAKYQLDKYQRIQNMAC